MPSLHCFFFSTPPTLHHFLHRHSMPSALLSSNSSLYIYTHTHIWIHLKSNISSAHVSVFNLRRVCDNSSRNSSSSSLLQMMPVELIAAAWYSSGPRHHFLYFKRIQFPCTYIALSHLSSLMLPLKLSLQGLAKDEGVGEPKHYTI
jgi:hypothetical protein